MLYRYFAINRQTYIVNHLSGIYFGYKYTLHLSCCSCNLIGRERPQRDRTEQSYLNAFGTCHLNGLLGYARCATECHNHIFGIVHELGFVANLVLTYLAILLLQVQIALLHNLRLQFERSDYVGLATL